MNLNESYEVDELPAPPQKVIPAADRELLELAARALGARFEEVYGEGYGNLHFKNGSVVYSWNPLQFSGDTFDLAVQLGLLSEHADFTYMLAEEQGRDDAELVEAARRAAVRAAAEIGKRLAP